MIVVTTHDSVVPIKGGGALRTTKVAKCLSDRGENVLLIAPAVENSFEGVPTASIPHLTGGASFFDMLAFSLRLFLELFKRRKTVEAIWAHNAAAAIPSLVFCKIYRKKIVTDVTDLHTEYMNIGKANSIRSIIIRILRKIEYGSFALSNRVIVVTEEMKKVLIEKGVSPDKIWVVYDGVDSEKFKRNGYEKNEIFTAMHHGGIQRQDGVEIIVDAAVILKKKGLKINFLIVGEEGPSREAFIRNVEKAGVSDYFIVRGWLSFEELIDCLSRSHVGLLARPANVSNNTITTLKLLDYWATELVPIVPRLRGIVEVADENSDTIFFEVGSASSMAEQIEWAYGNRNALHEISTRTRAKSKHFEWEKLVEQIVNISLDEFA